MADLSDFDETVLFFMNEMGSSATLILEGQGAYDVSTSSYKVTHIEIIVKAIMMDLTLQSNGLQTMNGTLIEAGDKRLYLQPVNKNNPNMVMPTIHPNIDKIRMGGSVYKIVTVKDYNPTTTNSVLLELYVRK